ncbi:hypothetical protein GQ44DRAFT_757738 [Phaeosphaeriaceae sp. PMI808]|nr:hypothetical protein GQ44DRAFT_757738 [Phaeosphaeriaceae sp. PMI808]
MSLPALQQNAYQRPNYPGSPADPHRDLLLGVSKRRPDDARRLRRVKDSREQLKTRTRARGASSATIDTSITTATTASSSSAAGRSYTVANVHHGVIYLRPTLHTRNQRSHTQPDPFVFPPQTPPDSANLDSLSATRPTSNEWEQSLHGSRTPRSEPTPLPSPDHAPQEQQQLRPLAHVRSHSFSTIDEHTVASLTNDPGSFKVVIERAPFGRPKTADTSSFPLLQVPIPDYRLGTPRFSHRGTLDLRSSVYTRSSVPDDVAISLLTPQRAGTHSFLSSRPRSDAYSPIPTSIAQLWIALLCPPQLLLLLEYPIRQFGCALLSLWRDTSSHSITSCRPHYLPSFLDYELLSDFFLTFRAFLSTRDLIAYLIARLRWAVDRQDDFGRIVRVRTFVALRHWILNYFADDFVPHYKLRVYFCELVNSLYRDLRNRADGGGGDIKIVGELKKCWRRTCAMYWEAADGIEHNFPDDDLLPGGQMGSQPSTEEFVPVVPTPTTPKRQVVRETKETMGANPSDQFASQHMEWAQRTRHTPQNSISSPYVPSHNNETLPVPLSPASEQSIHVLSCSIPMRVLNKSEQAIDLPPYPHPVPAGTTRLVASPQQVTSVKKMNQRSHAHKRSGSFSDALRDSRAPLSIPKHNSPETAASIVSHMPGSLVRGGLFQPGSPYIEIKSLRHARSHVQLEPEFVSAQDVEKSAYSTSPGMKKIFGSVRRALSTRQATGSTPYLTNSTHHRQPQSSRSSNSGPISTGSGGVQKRRTARGRPQVRIDLLASQVAGSFRDAVREQLETENMQRHSANPPDLGGFEFEFDSRNTPTSDDRERVYHELDPRVHSNITNGSKSILIIDDTGAPPLPTMSGALPVQSQKEVNVSTSAKLHNQAILDNEQTIDGNIHQLGNSDLDNSQDPLAANGQDRASRITVRRPMAKQRRSISEGREPGQMHSFRRRGSTKTSIARTGSLRRHASYNSVLSRRRGPDSVATFQTMSSNNDPFFLDQPTSGVVAPGRQLRRRPGGDLRAADHVQDLEHIQRPHSTGSISNLTHSVTNSVILRSDRYVDPLVEPSQQAEHVEVEAEAREPSKKPISLVDTHSSQPNLRPSFEAEVAKLAALPDDTDDEGGVESALMKLEGRYEKRSPGDSSPRDTLDLALHNGTLGEYVTLGEAHDAHNTQHQPLASSEPDGDDLYQLSAENFKRRVPAVSSQGGSEDSYSSIPLLDRGLSDITNTRHVEIRDTMRSSAKPLPLQLSNNTNTLTTSLNSSLEYVVETDSMKRIPTGATRPLSSLARESFLLDEDEDLSDRDAIGARSDGTSHGVRSFFDDEPATVDDISQNLPTHPMRHPPTPPLTAHRLDNVPPNPTVFERGLPTPVLTPPASRLNHQTFGSPIRLAESPIELIEPQEKSTTQPTHMPFVLAYDSEVLAQQFTIVEKDALDEIDWKELVELRWKQSSPQIRDWVHYLRSEEARGVDVVIARFNLVVKWVVSECVLTEDIQERARCIVKYIHIATHARRLRNYATMYQIAIALISNDVSRLRRTWALIPAAELHVMKELEAIVQPLRNFYNLRLEMETATVDDGCIPFIGIYTRDLIYNAQKPAFIDAPSVDGERLVNFERQHTAATIVKNLLRLLEASSKYTFKVEAHIISKCLWLAALTDDEISKRSRLCE